MMKKYLANGIDSFEKHEILEILLFNIFTRCNTNEISHRLLNEFKSIKGVLNANVNDLTTIKGVGENAATRICFLGDFFRYLSMEESNAVILDTPDRVFEFCKDLEDISTKEFFLILFLDKKQSLVSKYFVKGHFNSVYPVRREIIESAMTPTCTGAVAVHNHLGDYSAPSSADITVTRNLRKILGGVNINLYDHLILSGDSYYSMRTCEICRKIWL